MSIGNYNLSGLGVSNGKVVVKYWKLPWGGVPGPLETHTQKATPALEKSWEASYKKFRKALPPMWEISRRHSPLRNGAEVAKAQHALAQVVDEASACVISGWLGGAYPHDDFLNPSSLMPRSGSCPGVPLSVGTALLRLRGASPPVHQWVVENAYAKAVGKITNAEQNVTQAEKKIARETVAYATKQGRKVAKAVDEGMDQGLSIGGFLVRNAPMLLLMAGVAYVGVQGYAAYKVLR